MKLTASEVLAASIVCCSNSLLDYKENKRPLGSGTSLKEAHHFKKQKIHLKEQIFTVQSWNFKNKIRSVFNLQPMKHVKISIVFITKLLYSEE